MIGADAENIRRSSAMFLLKLKEHFRISQIAIDFIVERCRDLLSQTIVRAEAAVKARLAEVGIDLESVGDLHDIFQSVLDPFDGIDTCYLQEKYYREKFNLIVCMFLMYGYYSRAILTMNKFLF